VRAPKAGQIGIRFGVEFNDPSQLAPNCAMQGSAFADCIKSASTFMCDSNGQPHAVGCDPEATAVAACASGGPGDSGLTSD
jgi:hypothetical protein